MKIGYILTTFPCQSETFAAREIEELRKLGLDIVVFAAAGQQNEQAAIPKVFYRRYLLSLNAVLSICYIAVKYPLAVARLACLVFKLIPLCPREAISLIGNLHTLALFARHFDREGISNIHAYFLSWPACIGLGLAAVTNRSLSISAHARDIFVEHGATELKVAHAKFITTCTRQGLRHLKANLPAKYHHKLHLNYHGTRIDDRWFGCAQNISESYFNNRIIAVGRLIQKKGFAELLRAFALVVRDKPRCRLTIVGSGVLRKQLNGLIEQLALEDYVRLLGGQEHDITLRLIRRACVLVAPSVIADDGDRDGIPNVILEAFASGVPVIASNLEGISEVVRHRQTGLLVAPGDIRGLARAIEELLSNKDLRAVLSKKAYETAVQCFDSTKNAKQLAELFLRTN